MVTLVDTHAITGMFQTPQVFGMQCVMIPAYAVVVWWKVVCATRVGLDPESLSKLIELFFIHHIYVWCRAFVFIFEGIGIFEESTYTIAIMFAGFVCGPLTIGPAGNLLVVGVVATYCFCTLPYKENPEEGKLERRLNMFLNGKWRHHIDKLQGVAGINAMATKDAVAGSQEFQKTVSAPISLQPVKPIHKDGATTIAGARVTEVLVKPGQLVKPGAPLVKIQDRAPEAPGESTINARTIFDALDLDRSGKLECEEIVAVLVSWGVQRLEAENVVSSIRNKRLTEEDRARNFVYWENPQTGELEFKEEWEPIWRYQTNNINEAISKYRRFAKNDAARETKIQKDEAKQPTVTTTDIDVVPEDEYEKKARLGRLAASGELTDELGGMSYEEAADLKLAFRPADLDALEAHDIRDLLYNHLGMECLPGFPHVSSFLKAKDGDPFVFTYPGWLGICDLALYMVSVPFFFAGMFQLGGEEYSWTCYMGFCMLPHYFNDLFCFQTNVVSTSQHSACVYGRRASSHRNGTAHLHLTVKPLLPMSDRAASPPNRDQDHDAIQFRLLSCDDDEHHDRSDRQTMAAHLDGCLPWISTGYLSGCVHVPGSHDCRRSQRHAARRSAAGATRVHRQPCTQHRGLCSMQGIR